MSDALIEALTQARRQRMEISAALAPHDLDVSYQTSAAVMTALGETPGG